MMQVEVLRDAGRRRRWTREEQEAILRAAFAPGAVVKVVCRQNDISTGLLYGWRKRLWKGRTAVGFSQVVPVADPVVAQPAPCPVAIEVDIRGNKVCIPPSMPPALAAAVIRALMKR
jgi:transposase